MRLLLNLMSRKGEFMTLPTYLRASVSLRKQSKTKFDGLVVTFLSQTLSETLLMKKPQYTKIIGGKIWKMSKTFFRATDLKIINPMITHLNGPMTHI